jgi:hypothetical protein
MAEWAFGSTRSIRGTCQPSGLARFCGPLHLLCLTVGGAQANCMFRGPATCEAGRYCKPPNCLPAFAAGNAAGGYNFTMSGQERSACAALRACKADLSGALTQLSAHGDHGSSDNKRAPSKMISIRYTSTLHLSAGTPVSRPAERRAV